MTIKNFVDWNPLKKQGQPLFLRVVEIRDSEEGLSIIVESFKEKDETFLFFFNCVLAYRVIGESDLLKTLGENEIERFFQAKHTSFLDWFNEESSILHEDKDLSHFGIYTDDLCVDIITSLKPKVSKITGDNDP